MHLVLHIGAHGTDEGMIAPWLAANAAMLQANGVAVPAPRAFLRDLTRVLDHRRDADPHQREDSLLRGLGASGARRWMAVSAPGLLGSVADVIAPEGFYNRDVARRLLGLRTLFPRCRITLMLAVRAPSGLLPAILPDDPAVMADLMPLIDGETLPWARLVAGLRRHMPQARVIVWRHEDLPQVWPDVLAGIVGPDRPLPPAGLFDFAALGLSAEAQLRLRRYLATTRPGTAGQLRQLAGVFARRYGAAPQGGTVRDLPGWLHHELARLDRGYRTEWEDIASLRGIRVLAPADAESA